MICIFLILALVISWSSALQECSLSQSTVVDGHLCRQECDAGLAIILKPKGYIPLFKDRSLYSYLNTTIPQGQQYANCKCFCVKPWIRNDTLYLSTFIDHYGLHPTRWRRSDELVPFSAIGKIERLSKQIKIIEIEGSGKDIYYSRLLVHKEAFTHLSQLEKISFKYLNFPSPSDRFLPSTLSAVKFRNCYLTEFPTAVFKVSSPEILDFTDNRHLDFPLKSQYPLKWRTSIKKLFLRSTRRYLFPNGVLALEGLQHLDLGSKQMWFFPKKEEIPKGWRKNIKKLALDSNEFDSFPSGIFALENIQKLEIGSIYFPTLMVFTSDERKFIEEIKTFIHDLAQQDHPRKCPNKTSAIVVRADTSYPFKACLNMTSMAKPTASATVAPVATSPVTTIPSKPNTSVPSSPNGVKLVSMVSTGCLSLAVALFVTNLM